MPAQSRGGTEQKVYKYVSTKGLGVIPIWLLDWATMAQVDREGIGLKAGLSQAVKYQYKLEIPCFIHYQTMLGKKCIKCF